MSDTGLNYPSSYDATYTVTNPQNAYGTGTVNNSGAQYAKYINFGLSIPAGSTINGIEVQCRCYCDFGIHTAKATLYYNGKATAAPTTYTTTVYGSAASTKTLGGSTTNWGRTWAVGDFTNANFACRYDSKAGDFGYMDWIQVKVYYTTPTVPGIWANVAGADKRGAAVYVNVAGVSKTMNSMSVNVAGVAKTMIFS